MPAKIQIYSFAQLEQLWINAGGSRTVAPLMAAIALAESSGNPTSTNPHDNNGRQTSWGLWQISDGTHNMPVANILDPNVNAKEAVRKYRSQGLKAWGTYTSGAYRKFLSGAAPDPNLPTGSTSTAEQALSTNDIGNAIGSGLGSAFKSLMEPVISTSIWGGEIIFGITLMGLAVFVFIIGTNIGRRAAGTGATLAAAAVPEVGIPLKMGSSALKGGRGGKRKPSARQS